MKHLFRLFITSFILISFTPLKAQLSSIPYENGVYQLSTSEHLMSLSAAVVGGDTTEGRTFRLMQDIDMKNITTFIPIGGWKYSSETDTYIRVDQTQSLFRNMIFRGTFDGNHHKILNLSIIKNGEIKFSPFGYLGVFGLIDDARVENLFVEDFLVDYQHSFDGFGGIIGGSYNSVIFNCHAKMFLQGGASMYGGITSYAYESTITKCSSISSFTTLSAPFSMGGFIGTVENCIISNCFSKGTISNYLTNGQYIAVNIGGFIGIIRGKSIVKNCYSCTDITASGVFLRCGGFAGLNGRNTSIGPSKEEIEQRFSDTESTEQSVVFNCYVVPDVFEVFTSNLSKGLFAGENNDTIRNCFYSTAIFGYEGIGYSNPEASALLYGKSDTEIQTPLMVAVPGTLGSSLNFELHEPAWTQDVAPFVNNGFPILKWEKEVGIQENKMKSSVKIYPNPTNGQLTIDNGQLIINSIEVFDVYGRNLSKISNVKSNISNLIDISHLISGIYFIKIKTLYGMVVKKIIKN